MVKLSNVAEALGILGGAAAQGYAQGAISDIMAKRQAYHEHLKAAREQQATMEDRAFRSEEAEKGRGFQREMSVEEREWDREKFGLEQAASERRMRLEASLRPKAQGPQAPASIQEWNALSKLKAEMAGRDAPTAQDKMEAWREMNAKSSDLPSAIEEVDLKLTGELGRPPTAAERSTEMRRMEKGKSKDNSVTFVQLNKMVQDRRKEIDPYGMLQGDKAKAADAQAAQDVKAALDDAGVSYPGQGSRPAPADEDIVGGKPTETSRQGSVRGNPQPGVVVAPATSTRGDNTKFEPPMGQGSKANPYVAETEEQAIWAAQNGPADSWVLYQGKRFQVEGVKK